METNTSKKTEFASQCSLILSINIYLRYRKVAVIIITMDNLTSISHARMGDEKGLLHSELHSELPPGSSLSQVTLYNQLFCDLHLPLCPSTTISLHFFFTQLSLFIHPVSKINVNAKSRITSLLLFPSYQSLAKYLKTIMVHFI